MSAPQRGVRFKRTLSRAELAKRIKAAFMQPRALDEICAAFEYPGTLAVVRVKAGESMSKGTKAKIVDTRWRYVWTRGVPRDVAEVRVSYRDKGKAKLRWVSRELAAWGIAV